MFSHLSSEKSIVSPDGSSGLIGSYKEYTAGGPVARDTNSDEPSCPGSSQESFPIIDSCRCDVLGTTDSAQVSIQDCALTPGVKEGLLAQWLEAYVGPVSVRASKLHRHDIALGSWTLWLGPILNQRWNTSQEPCYEVSSSGQGYGITMTLRLPWCCRAKATLMMFLMCRKQQRGGLSVQWNLSLSRVVPKDAKIMKCVQADDLQQTRALFQMGDAAPSDISPEGITLLHVSLDLLEFLHPQLLTKVSVQIAARNCSTEMILLLLQQGADVNAMDEDGE